MAEDKKRDDTQEGKESAQLPVNGSPKLTVEDLADRPYFPDMTPVYASLPVATGTKTPSVQNKDGKQKEGDGPASKSDTKPKTYSDAEVRAILAEHEAMKNGTDSPRALEGPGEYTMGAGNRFNDELFPRDLSAEDQNAWLSRLLSQSSLHPDSGQPGSWVDQVQNDHGANHGADSHDHHGQDGHGSDDVSGHSR